MSAIQSLLVENHQRPYATFNLILRQGSLRDPVGKEGLTYLAANMLLRGTDAHNQQELAEAIEQLGSMVDISVGKDAVFLRADGLKRNQETLLGLISEVLTRSTIPQDELDKLRRQTQAEIVDLRNHDEALARQFFLRLLYDGHTWGRLGKGSIESLDQVTRDDIVAWLDAHLRRDDLFLACSGDVTPDEQDALVDEHLAAIPAGKNGDAGFPAVVPPQGRTVLLLDKPERTQTQVVMGHLCIDANHPDYFPMLLANTIFGGTFTARLSREIREKRGWSYGAYSHVSPGLRTGSFSLRFFPTNEHTPPAIALTFSLLEDLVASGVTDEELTFAQSNLVNQFPFRIDTAPKRLEQEIWTELFEWPPDFLDRYVERVKATTREEIAAALRRNIHPNDLVVTVVGTAAEVQSDLEKLEGVRQVLVHPHDVDWPLPPDGVPRR